VTRDVSARRLSIFLAKVGPAHPQERSCSTEAPGGYAHPSAASRVLSIVVAEQVA
jgi:hypothetical protein